MNKKNAAQTKLEEEHLTAERLKPCPKCGRECAMIFLTGCARDLLDVSVKCQACGYEYNMGRLQDDTTTALSKAHNFAVKVWNALPRPNIEMNSEAD